MTNRVVTGSTPSVICDSKRLSDSPRAAIPLSCADLPLQIALYQLRMPITEQEVKAFTAALESVKSEVFEANPAGAAQLLHLLYKFPLELLERLSLPLLAKKIPLKAVLLAVEQLLDPKKLPFRSPMAQCALLDQFIAFLERFKIFCVDKQFILGMMSLATQIAATEIDVAKHIFIQYGQNGSVLTQAQSRLSAKEIKAMQELSLPSLHLLTAAFKGADLGILQLILAYATPRLSAPTLLPATLQFEAWAVNPQPPSVTAVRELHEALEKRIGFQREQWLRDADYPRFRRAVSWVAVQVSSDDLALLGRAHRLLTHDSSKTCEEMSAIMQEMRERFPHPKVCQQLPPIHFRTMHRWLGRAWQRIVDWERSVNETGSSRGSVSYEGLKLEKDLRDWLLEWDYAWLDQPQRRLEFEDVRLLGVKALSWFWGNHMTQWKRDQALHLKIVERAKQAEPEAAMLLAAMPGWLHAEDLKILGPSLHKYPERHFLKLTEEWSKTLPSERHKIETLLILRAGLNVDKQGVFGWGEKQQADLMCLARFMVAHEQQHSPLIQWLQFQFEALWNGVPNQANVGGQSLFRAALCHSGILEKEEVAQLLSRMFRDLSLNGCIEFLRGQESEKLIALMTPWHLLQLLQRLTHFVQSKEPESAVANLIDALCARTENESYAISPCLSGGNAQSQIVLDQAWEILEALLAKTTITAPTISCLRQLLKSRKRS